MEEHLVDGKPKRLLVHRKGSTRAFPPHHPLIPVGTSGASGYSRVLGALIRALGVRCWVYRGYWGVVPGAEVGWGEPISPRRRRGVG